MRRLHQQASQHTRENSTKQPCKASTGPLDAHTHARRYAGAAPRPATASRAFTRADLLEMGERRVCGQPRAQAVNADDGVAVEAAHSHRTHAQTRRVNPEGHNKKSKEITKQV